VDWIDLARYGDRWWSVLNTVMHCQVPDSMENCLSSWARISLSRRTVLRGVIWLVG
jgi:hypothetical protein